MVGPARLYRRGVNEPPRLWGVLAAAMAAAIHGRPTCLYTCVPDRCE